MKTENGKVNMVRRNSDGSVDYGPMQINSIHLPELSKYGITASMLVGNECLNIFIGTFLLQRHILKAPNFWAGVGNYHSKTPSKNKEYQYLVYGALLNQQIGAPK